LDFFGFGFWIFWIFGLNFGFGFWIFWIFGFGFGFGFQNPKPNPKSKIFWIPVSDYS